VGVAGVTVFASEFAASIGIDGPIKGDAAGFAFVQDGFYGKQKVFRALLGFAERGSGGRNGSEAGDANQRRRTVWYSVM
jgi:hypothetical protein